MDGVPGRARSVSIMAPFVIVASAVALFIAVHSFDLRLPDAPEGYLQSVLTADPSTARYTLTAMATCLATSLAITIALVLIVVQLTASRYTPRLIDLFVEAKLNFLLLATFIGTIIYCFYVANTIGPEFAPRMGIISCLALTTLCMASLIPYLVFVLDFVNPRNIIGKLESRATRCLKPRRWPAKRVSEVKLRLSQTLEQITDMAKGSLRVNDTGIALASISALSRILGRYLAVKGQCPASWFTVEPGVFLGLSREYAKWIEQDRSWVEVKGLRELASILEAGLDSSPEIATAIGVSARSVGESALASGDKAVVDLLVKYFNTFVREAITAGQKLSIYNLLQEYRLLAEQCLAPRPDVAVRASEHWTYYGRLAEAHGLGFIAETVAYDLRVLNEEACQRGCARAPDILAVLISFGETMEREGHPRALPGIHKMWLMLGSLYSSKGADSLRDQVCEALSRVAPETLAQLGEELLRTTDPEFWEITDRGVNFDYLPPDLRPHLSGLLKQLCANACNS